MAYPTRTYIELLYDTCNRAGIIPERLLSNDEEAIRASINVYLREGWECYPWPRLTTVGSVAIEDLNGTYRNRDVINIYQFNPLDYRFPRALEYTQTVTGFHIINEIADGTIIYPEYRLRFNTLTGDPVDPSKTDYADGDKVYDPVTEDYYMAIATADGSNLSDTDEWQRLSIPAFLFDYTRGWASAELLSAAGQDEKAVLIQQKADAALQLEKEKVERFRGLKVRATQQRRYAGN